MPITHLQTGFRVDPRWQPALRELGIDADAIFDHPLIQPWRTLSDRDNCTLDATLANGRAIRWHIKRFKSATAVHDAAGIQLLRSADIPTIDLVGWGTLTDGRSFVILDDLDGFEACDKLIERGEIDFERLLKPTAHLAARLHRAGLHHRDMYLCHFFARKNASVDVRLIDAARVKRLPHLFARRWIVKDLAQFWYSTNTLPITEEQRLRWLKEYGGESLRPAILRKVRWIERHDRRLRRRQPQRNISIPQSS